MRRVPLLLRLVRASGTPLPWKSRTLASSMAAASESSVAGDSVGDDFSKATARRASLLARLSRFGREVPPAACCPGSCVRCTSTARTSCCVRGRPSLLQRLCRGGFSQFFFGRPAASDSSEARVEFGDVEDGDEPAGGAEPWLMCFGPKLCSPPTLDHSNKIRLQTSVASKLGPSGPPRAAPRSLSHSTRRASTCDLAEPRGAFAELPLTCLLRLLIAKRCASLCLLPRLHQWKAA